MISDGFLSLVERNSLQLENARTDRALAEVQERLVRTQIYPVIGGQLGYTRNFTDIEQQVPVAAINVPRLHWGFPRCSTRTSRSTATTTSPWACRCNKNCLT